MPFSASHPSLRKTLTARGYAAPTPVQAAILAPEVAGRDLLVSAQTGSGKTVAFGLALAPTLLGEAERFTPAGAPRALIVTPTRELALQVHRELTWLYAETGARITTCVGGMDPRRESYALSQGMHIVVGTPGRLCDHLERGSLVLERLAAVVLDEADEMLDMGFREDLERLLDAATSTERRTLLFSATIPPQIATMAKRYQKDALRIATASPGDRHVDIEYTVVSIVPRERDLAVVNLLRYYDPPGALVFCGTRDGVSHLAANLSERGFSVAALSGELSQRERNQALQALRDGRARVCVATDVAARGLDLPNLDLVIHADLPQSREALVHRSGRTGRAGKKGQAIIIAADAARRYVERMLQGARIEAAWKLPPSSDDIRARDQANLAGEIQALTEDVSDADRAVAQALLAERSAEDLVAALVRLRREVRPAPEELTVPASMRPRVPGERVERDRFGRERVTRYAAVRGDFERPQRNDRFEHNNRPERTDRNDRHAVRPEARPERTVNARPERAVDARPERTVNARPERTAEARPERAVDARPERAVDAQPERAVDAQPERAVDARPERAVEPRPVDARAERHDRAQRPERTVEARPEPAKRHDRAEHARRSVERVHTDHAPSERGNAERESDLLALLGPGGGGRGDARDQVWFTINVGRSKNADPKWLIPLLCRRGGISKNAIGKIQIMQRETRVEIASDVSERFAAAVREPDTKDRNIHIEPIDTFAY